jgi:cytochrome c-type biogenesis protein CcmH
MDPSMEGNPRAGSHPPDPRQARPGGGRHGIRTVVLSAAALVALASLAIGVLWNSLAPPEGTASRGGPAMESARTGSELSPSAAEGPAIAGRISVAPELRGRVSDGDTLFIIARKGAGGISPPFAVKRITGPHFPLEYRLGPGDVMMAGTAFEGDVHLSVRLSKSGAAGPGEPGDLEGEHPGQVPVGARGVNIVIARVR